jgi:hypothetical protein
MEALEHTAVAERSLMRAVADAGRDGLLVGAGDTSVLAGLALTFRQMAAGVDAFGELVRNEGDVQDQLSASDVERLGDALRGLHEADDRLDAALATDPGDLLELHTYARTTVRRLLNELDLEERVRRQVQLGQPRPRRPRTPRRRPQQPLWEPSGPDDETQPLPRLPGEGQ